MIWVLVVAGFMLAALALYSITGGADFGGGVWDLLARGPRAEAQRNLIEKSLAPIWEANHVWLIIVVVLLFVAFPEAFYASMVALQLPLFVVLFGIVLRGSAFVFRQYGGGSDQAVRLWTRVFAISSLVTPFALGVSFGAVTSGNVVTSGPEQLTAANFINSWWAPWPMVVGVLVVVIFAWLASVYLAAEAGNDELRQDFKRRAFVSAAVGFVVALAALIIARDEAPWIYRTLLEGPRAVLFQALVGMCAVGALVSLRLERFAIARMLAAGQVVLMLFGWAVAQYPWVIPESLTLFDAAAPVSVLKPIAVALAIGLIAITPAFFWLYRTFTGQPRDDVP